jgi:hypothetical protein
VRGQRQGIPTARSVGMGDAHALPVHALRTAQPVAWLVRNWPGHSLLVPCWDLPAARGHGHLGCATPQQFGPPLAVGVCRPFALWLEVAGGSRRKLVKAVDEHAAARHGLCVRRDTVALAVVYIDGAGGSSRGAGDSAGDGRCACGSFWRRGGSRGSWCGACGEEGEITDHLRDQAARKRKLWALQALINRIWPSFFSVLLA